MLIILQFPFADVRRFVDENSVLARPNWPTPQPDQDFVRGFGSIRRRKRGGIEGWLGENEICDAKQGVRFEEFPVEDFRCAFRRLFFDEFAVGKLEIGFSSKGLVSTKISKNSFFTSILNIPVKLPNPRRSKETKNNVARTILSTYQLGNVGNNLAELYCKHTMRNKNSPIEPWWVTCGVPLMFLEYNEDEIVKIADSLNVKKISIPDSYGISLRHCFVKFYGIQIPLWILGRQELQIKTTTKIINYVKRYINPLEYEREHKEARIRQFNTVRALRLYLLRLHAEHQCLKTVLRHMAETKLVVSKFSYSTQQLQRYLNNATTKISRWQNKSQLLIEADIADIARIAEDQISPGQRDSLLQILEREKLRFNLLDKIRDYTTLIMNTNGGAITVANNTDSGNKYNIQGGNIGAVGDKAKAENFTNVITSGTTNIDFDAVGKELDLIRTRLKEEVKVLESQNEDTSDYDEAIGTVASAKKALEQKNESTLKTSLKTAGKFLFDFASKVGASLITEIIKQHMGM